MKELALVFLKLGSIAFGGPAAHIAMMEEEVVKRRGWITHEHFLDLIGATNLIPGPNSTEMAIHIGYIRNGWKGILVAGLSFIIPAVLITMFFANLYVTYGTLPELTPFVKGIRSGIIAVILAAVVRLGKPVAKNTFMLVVGIAVIVLNLLHVNEILLLFGSGFAGLAWNYRKHLNRGIVSVLAISPSITSSSPVHQVNTLPESVTLTALGVFFLKIGSIMYGSGFVLVAFLQSELVDKLHWLTQSQLLDAIAVGQFTPGPLSSTATFIGFVLLGFPGALIATTGMFLPAFIFVLISNPFIPKLRKSPLTRGFLDGVNAAALGLMVAVTIFLSYSALSSTGSWMLFLASLLIMIRWNLNAGWIVVGSALMGWVFTFFHIY